MKFLISILAAVSLIVIGVPILKVNAQEILNDPSIYYFGTVSEGASYKTGLTHFTVTNNSAFAVNITISGIDMTGGGVTWTLSEDASTGTNIYGLRAGREDEVEGNDYITVVPKSSANTLVSELATGTQRWGLQLLAPTSFSDGALKSGIVTLTATQACGRQALKYRGNETIHEPNQ